MDRSRCRAYRGFALVELLVVIAIIGLLASIAIPNLLIAHRNTRYSRAASDSKTLVTQAILYGNDHGAYPTSVATLRTGGYTNVPDVDPWSTPWQLAPPLLAGAPPRQAEDVYIYSRGGDGSGVYPDPFLTHTGDGGSVGYSFIYGSWTGR
jgi:general secretion pathway protein G